MHTKTKLHLTTAAILSFILLLLLNLVPGMKASAATKYYSVSYSGGTVSYYNSSVTTLSSDSNVSVYCSNKGSYSITVKPNSSTSSRTIRLYAKKSGTVVDTLVITQSGVPTSNLSATNAGGNLYYYNGNAYSYYYSNTAVCSSRSGNYFVIKPNTSTASRYCTVTVKNRSGNAIAYVYISQSGVPLKYVSVAGGDTSFSYGKSGAYFNYSNKSMITNITASNPGSYTIYVSANPSSTATRSTDIIVKNGSGVYLEIIRVTQAAFTAPTHTYNYNSDPRTVTYNCANADASKTTVSNTALCSCTSLGSGKFQVKLNQNTSTASRSCTITFKNSAGTVLAKYVINQSGVPLKYVSVSGGNTSFSYSKSGAYFTISNKNMITNVTASNAGSYTLYVSANPSNTSSRSTDVIVKNGSGVYLEIIRVTQSAYTAPTINYSVDSKRNVITYTNSNAAKFSYSNSSMCNSYTSLGSGKYQFVIKANSYRARTETINVFDKYDTVIAKLYISQGAVVSYTVGSGEGENISYYNKDAIKFNLPINIKSVRATSAGNFIFTQTVNRGTLTLDYAIEVLDGSNNIIQYIRVVSQPNVMRIKGDFGDNNVPNAGKSYNVSFETSNPVTVTLTNAKFSDGTTTKSINKNAVKANSYNTTSYTIKVDALSKCDNRQVKINVSNGLSTETKILTQLGKGHVFEQQQAGVGSSYCTMKCSKCGKEIKATTSTRTLDEDCDVYIYYERPDGTGGFGTQTMSKVNYEKKNDGNGRSIYVFRLYSSKQFGMIWNEIMPKNVHNIYYYGHQDSFGTLEFRGECLSLEECFDTEIKMANSNTVALKNKSVSGEVYMLTCNAGTRANEGLNLNAMNNIFTKVKDTTYGKHLTEVFDKNFSTLRFFAYICPDADVIGLRDNEIDYDGSKNGVITPTKHVPLAGDFISEKYNSEKDAFETTKVIGGDSDMKEKYYAS